MAVAIYSLCMLLALALAVLLWRHHRRTRSRLLFWSALCFVGLTANNLLLVLDQVVLPHLELSLWRQLTALGAMTVLLYGLVYEDD